MSCVFAIVFYDEVVFSQLYWLEMATHRLLRDQRRLYVSLLALGAWRVDALEVFFVEMVLLQYFVCCFGSREREPWHRSNLQLGQLLLRVCPVWRDRRWIFRMPLQ